jgi:DNA repair exonuclease SbcCD ATPase subunit
MIKFTKIFWKNLLSTGNRGIEIQLDRTNTTILFGASGSGKSTLLDAITFCLFNKPFRNINKPKLVNAINESDCLVIVEFEVNNKSYRIVRGIKPNIFQIFENNTLLNQDSSNRDYQLILEQQILKINYRTFLQVVMLGAANFTPFMQLKPSDRRAIIEDLLDIQIFSTMNNLLKEKSSICKQSMHDLEIKLLSVDQKMQMVKNHIHSLENIRDMRIDEVQTNIESDSQILKSLYDDLRGLEQKKSEMITKNLASLESSILKFNNLKGSLESDRTRIMNDIHFIQSNSNCPTCKQEINDNIRNAEILKKTEILEEIDKGIDVAVETIKKYAKLKSETIEVKEQVNVIDLHIKELMTSIKFYENSITNRQDELLKLKSADIEMQNYRNELNGYIEEISKFQEQKVKLSKEQQVIEYSSLILKDSGVKSKILQEYIPYINQYVNVFLNSMSFFVSFKLDENFEEQIKSKGRDFFNYENFSEGERQRLDLALLFTWRCIAKAKNSVNTNLLIMDEVLDSYLDTSATENVLSIFKEDLFNDTNIIVISHKENIIDKFDRVIKYTIEKGFSHAEL